jgi:hypothetical protein
VNDYKDFSDSYKKGQELSEAWWTKMGRAGSVGKAKIQPAMWIFNMKNRFKWTDRQDMNISGDMTNIKAADMSPEERKERIKQILEKYKKE